MGHWSIYCQISRRAITGQPVVVIPIKKTQDRYWDNYCNHSPVGLPIFGEYDTYGRLENITETPYTKFLESHSEGKSIQEICDYITSERDDDREDTSSHGENPFYKDWNFFWVDRKVWDIMSTYYQKHGWWSDGSFFKVRMEYLGFEVDPDKEGRYGRYEHWVKDGKKLTCPYFGSFKWGDKDWNSIEDTVAHFDLDKEKVEEVESKYSWCAPWYHFDAETIGWTYCAKQFVRKLQQREQEKIPFTAEEEEGFKKFKETIDNDPEIQKALKKAQEPEVKAEWEKLFAARKLEPEYPASFTEFDRTFLTALIDREFVGELSALLTFNRNMRPHSIVWHEQVQYATPQDGEEYDRLAMTKLWLDQQVEEWNSDVKENNVDEPLSEYESLLIK